MAQAIKSSRTGEPPSGLGALVVVGMWPTTQPVSPMYSTDLGKLVGVAWQNFSQIVLQEGIVSQNARMESVFLFSSTSLHTGVRLVRSNVMLPEKLLVAWLIAWATMLLATSALVAFEVVKFVVRLLFFVSFDGCCEKFES